jgi:PAP2 superfamily protein
VPKGLRTAALAAVAVGLATPPLRKRLDLPPPATSLLSWQTPVAVALGFPRTRLRNAAVYASQMWAYIAHYELPNDDPDRLLARVRIDYPMDVDTVLGGGEMPTVRLQRALGRPGEIRPHDTALSIVHWSWFFAPHGAVAYILWRHPERFGRSATLMAAVFDLGVVCYFAFPTAPPWWAGGKGGRPYVRRIMIEAGEKFWGRYWTRLYDSLAGNPLAAMPSLHFATSVMAARVLSDVGRTPGALGWIYAGALGFALVYLGEHYVVDLLAGLALAEGVRRAEPAFRPAARAIERAVRGLEPGTT